MNKIKDHLGNEFKCADDMYRFWGISPSTVYSRRKRGLSLEDTLETPIDTDKDYNFKVFESTYRNLADACEAYNINIDDVYAYSKANGVTYSKAVEDIFNEEYSKFIGNDTEEISLIVVEDEEELVKVSDLCRLWEVDYDTYRYRKSLGWDLRHILEG